MPDALVLLALAVICAIGCLAIVGATQRTLRRSDAVGLLLCALAVLALLTAMKDVDKTVARPPEAAPTPASEREPAPPDVPVTHR